MKKNKNIQSNRFNRLNNKYWGIIKHSLCQKLYFTNFSFVSLAGNQLWFIINVPFYFIAENYKCALAE